MTSDKDKAAMLGEIDALISQEDPDVPDDAVTSDDYAKRKGITVVQARNRLYRGVTSGKLKKGRKYTENGRLVVHFWVAVDGEDG